MKYISLFSGIGGFEIAIHNIFPNAECLGYSEIDKFAKNVYEKHYPEHKNLGDITMIEEKDIKTICKNGCNLVVGGFPCQNLTSLSRYNPKCDSNGLKGEKSGLFYTMLNIIKWITEINPNVDIIIENSASMTNNDRDEISNRLEKVLERKIYSKILNGSNFGVQARRRRYWTTFELYKNIEIKQNWNDILLNIEECRSFASDIFIQNTMNKIHKNDKINPILLIKENRDYIFHQNNEIKGITRWQKRFHSTTYEYCSPIIRHRTCPNNVLIDTRNNKIIPRYFEPIEIERLFFIPDGYVSNYCSKSRCSLLLGNTVIVKVIEYILSHI
jgi:DNA-cytosine methyltransferase